MASLRLYGDLAYLWPQISPPADYAAEARVIGDVLKRRLHLPSGRRPTVLELGAGGGHTLRHLTSDVDAVAVDLSEAMLANCRKLNPTVETIVGDMRTIRLDRTFDAVIIHDAIDYMQTRQDVLATLATAGTHLRPDGLLLVAPSYVQETFEQGAVESESFESDGREITSVMLVVDRDERDTTFDLLMVFLIREGGLLRIVSDRHTCGLFAIRTWLAMFEEAGFAATVNDDEVGWTLFVAGRSSGQSP